MIRDLRLALRAEYFDQIRDGSKTYEYRLATPYWSKRLDGKSYDRIILTSGYPQKNDQNRTIIRRWKTCVLQTINHPHFGPEDVQVYAIRVN